MPKPEPQTTIDQAFLDVIRGGKRFVLCGHEHPDGDCLGASVAMHALLTGLGREAWIWNPDPPIPPLRFLERHAPLRALSVDGPPPECDVVILLDCARLQRLGRLGELIAARNVAIAVVDHHVGSEDGDGQVCLVDTAAPATGALVHRLFAELGVELTPAAAEGVFVSLIADTGWFRYSNTTAEVFDIAAALLRCGVDASFVYDRMFRRNHADSVALLASSLAAASVDVDGCYAAAVLDRGQLDHASRIGFDTDGIMEPLRSLAGIEVVGFFKERFDGTVKVSLRASGDVDVEVIARALGGGGHRKAAGATVTGTLDDVRAEVGARVRAAIAAVRAGGGDGRADP